MNKKTESQIHDFAKELALILARNNCYEHLTCGKSKDMDGEKCFMIVGEMDFQIMSYDNGRTWTDGWSWECLPSYKSLFRTLKIYDLQLTKTKCEKMCEITNSILDTIKEL
ncbi:MAG: hypothetical protein J6W54_05595 [Fibrobacter sp.]|uniref:hypothetical protein n=1 Tax=Fibrobacter sp. TaxID=35828 RepID=UPI001B15E4A2|nr:hypothetical protein [Fibrobacter sp.]MBO7060556.1 hypothetical protein [Fibrobacter sp.]